jgi:hypothetical protein
MIFASSPVGNDHAKVGICSESQLWILAIVEINPEGLAFFKFPKQGPPLEILIFNLV